MDLKQLLFGNKKLGHAISGIFPRLKAITGDLNSAIVLSRIIYWHFKSGRGRFYKFNAPCDHNLYRLGDSWVEETGMGLDAFMRARSRIATKITTGISKSEARKDSLVIYYTDSQRRTWYELNEALLLKWITDFFLGDNSSPRNGENFTHPNYLEAAETPVTSTSTPTTTLEKEESGIAENDVDIKEPEWWSAAQRELRGMMTRATYEKLLLGSRLEALPDGYALRVGDTGSRRHLLRYQARLQTLIQSFVGGGPLQLTITS